MIKISKKIENGILALQYISSKQGELVSAKEIADNLNLTFDFISKILQLLKSKGLIISVQGKSGGYKLKRQSSEISIGEIIEALENRAFISMVDCSLNNTESTCGRTPSCSIKHTMNDLQDKINSIIYSTSLSEFGDPSNYANFEK